MSKKYFLYSHNCKFEVSKEDYVDFYKQKRRVKYLKEVDELHGLVSYQANDSNSFSGEEYLVNTDQQSVEEIAVRNIMITHLQKAMDRLTTDELFLINALFFESKTERDVAAQQGINQFAIHKKKKRILSKLKRILEN